MIDTAYAENDIEKNSEIPEKTLLFSGNGVKIEKIHAAQAAAQGMISWTR